jgi:hypothetical protein
VVGGSWWVVVEDVDISVVWVIVDVVVGGVEEWSCRGVSASSGVDEGSAGV